MSSANQASTAHAQKVRLQRMFWGFGNQLCSLTIAVMLFWFGLVPGTVVIAYVLMIAVIDLTFVGLVVSHLNLRLREPSMTAAQIVAPLWPSIFLMFFIEDPQARTAFLLMATGGLLFGMFALTLRGMIQVGALILLAYLIMLGTLAMWAPERLNWQVETVIVFAYAAVLLIVSYLGSFIAGMRRALKKQNAVLRDLATRDPLTRLPNRRTVLDQLAQEKSRTERRQPDQNALCISMLDVDNFKRINDIYGHHAGDEVLVKIGSMLEKTMRKGDFIGRFGGEEFVIILPETTPHAASSAAERIRKAVSELAYSELPADERITVSQGVAIHSPGDEIDVTLRRADDALRAAKAQGRNQVVAAPDP